MPLALLTYLASSSFFWKTNERPTYIPRTNAYFILLPPPTTTYYPLPFAYYLRPTSYYLRLVMATTTTTTTTRDTTTTTIVVVITDGVVVSTSITTTIVIVITDEILWIQEVSRPPISVKVFSNNNPFWNLLECRESFDESSVSLRWCYAKATKYMPICRSCWFNFIYYLKENIPIVVFWCKLYN